MIKWISRSLSGRIFSGGQGSEVGVSRGANEDTQERVIRQCCTPNIYLSYVG